MSNTTPPYNKNKSPYSSTIIDCDSTKDANMWVVSEPDACEQNNFLYIDDDDDDLRSSSWRLMEHQQRQNHNDCCPNVSIIFYYSCHTTAHTMANVQRLQYSVYALWGNVGDGKVLSVCTICFVRLSCIFHWFCLFGKLGPFCSSCTHHPIWTTSN